MPISVRRKLDSDQSHWVIFEGASALGKEIMELWYLDSDVKLDLSIDFEGSA